MLLTAEAFIKLCLGLSYFVAMRWDVPVFSARLSALVTLAHHIIVLCTVPILGIQVGGVSWF